MRRMRKGLALMVVAWIAPAFAVGLNDLKGFEAIFGRYGPKGDCTKYPQVVIDVAGFALDQGNGKIQRATRPEYAASFFGPEYDGIAKAFFPYWTDAGPNPFIATVNHDDQRGRLVIEPHDLGWKGGPPMPPRYQPWLQGSPYAKCK